MPIVTATRRHAPNPHVRRRWKLFATLIALTVLGSDAALGFIFGGIRIEGSMAQRLPFASPLVAGIGLACTVAAPMGVAAYLTLGSYRQADTAVRIAGSLFAITTVLALTTT